MKGQLAAVDRRRSAPIDNPQADVDKAKSSNKRSMLDLHNKITSCGKIFLTFLGTFCALNVCCNQLHLVAAIEDDMSHFDRAHWHPRSGATTTEDARLSPLLSSVVILVLSAACWAAVVVAAMELASLF